MRIRKTLAGAFIAAITATCSAAAAPDTIYHGANIYTMSEPPRAEAIAIEGGRIVLAGSEDQVLSLRGPKTIVIDAHGATILPGLIDAHGHLMGLGQLETGVVDLSGTTSYEQVIGLIADRAEQVPAGTWILGHGWDHESWDSKELPVHDELSRSVPDHPVWLARVDGHAGLANAVAMDLAGVDRDSRSPAGGEIITTASQEPTGVFIDNAEAFIARVIPESATPSARETLLAAQRLCFEVGLTGVHDMGVPPDVVSLMSSLRDAGELRLRVNAMIPSAFAVRYFEENKPFTGEVLTVNGVKIYADGAMGSRGAWLLEPYSDRPTRPDGEPYMGLAVTDPIDLRSHADHAIARGYQVAAHAIGDRANRTLLDTFEEASQSQGIDLSERRWRIEHAQLLSPDDIPRFAGLGVIASMQPTHCTSDMRWVEDRVGPERAAGAYAWASLLRSGALIASGSDFPVESHNPLLGFYAAITRQNQQAQPEGGWRSEQRMTRQETLRSMTLDAAYAGFREQDVGSLEPGKLADLILLDTDIMTCEPFEILTAQVLRTVLSGEVVFERETGLR